MSDSPVRPLVDRIAKIRPIDRAGKLALARDLRALRGRMLPSVAREAIDRLEAATLLMGFLAHAEEVTPESLQIVARLVAGLGDDHFAPQAQPVTPPTSAIPKSVAEHRDLQLTSACLLGEILVHLGVITLEQLDQALQMQIASHVPVGQCLQQLGFATAVQVQRAVDIQRRLRGGGGPDALVARSAAGPALELRLGSGRERALRKPNAQLLGEILLRQGAVTKDQLEQGLRRHRAAGVHLGEALVEMGAVTWDGVKRALAVQERLRAG